MPHCIGCDVASRPALQRRNAGNTVEHPTDTMLQDVQLRGDQPKQALLARSTSSRPCISARICALLCVLTLGGADIVEDGDFGLQVGFPLRWTKQGEAAVLVGVPGPACASKCNITITDGAYDTDAKLCYTHRFLIDTQYVYRYNPVLKVCHYLWTDVPSDLARSIGAGLVRAFTVLLVACTVLWFFDFGPLCVLVATTSLFAGLWFHYWIINFSEPAISEASLVALRLAGSASSSYSSLPLGERDEL